MAATVPSTGRPAPTTNQMKNELPLILPITPADSPKKKIRTRYGPMAPYSRRLRAQRIATTAAIATTVHATAATTPITTLNSTYAPISRTPTASALPPRFDSAPPLRFSMFSLMPFILAEGGCGPIDLPTKCRNALSGAEPTGRGRGQGDHLVG